MFIDRMGSLLGCVDACDWSGFPGFQTQGRCLDVKAVGSIFVHTIFLVMYDGD